MVVILIDDRVTDVGHPPVITGTAERPVQILCLFTNSEINRVFMRKTASLFLMKGDLNTEERA